MKPSRFLWGVLCILTIALPIFAANSDDSRDSRSPLDQGGDVCSSALPITSIPFCDTGTTSGFNNDYPTPCQPNANARDVVYSYTPTQTAVLSFSLCGSSFNTAMTIWRGCPTQGGVLVCCSDDVCDDDACCSGVTLAPGSTFYVVVDGGLGPNNFGNYLFNVVPGVDVCPSTPCSQNTCPYPNQDIEPNNTCASGGGVITCGDTLCGIVEPNGNDYYYLDIFGNGCQDVTIDVFGNGTPGFYPYGLGLDPALNLYDGVCSVFLGGDNGSGIDGDARFTICLEPGIYRLLINGQNSSSGPYVIATSCTPCECPQTCPYENRDQENVNNLCGTFNPPMVCGDTLCGDLSPTQDNHDWYLLTVVGPGMIRVKIDVFGNDTPGLYPFGQGLDPLVRLVELGCTNIVAADTAGGIGEDAQIEVCVPQGSYNIQVQSEDFTSGPYILATSCEPCDECPYPNLDVEPLNNTCGTNNEVLHCGDGICGTIAGAAAPDQDWYVLQVPQCTQLFINLFGNDSPGWYPFGQGLNPAIELWSADCQTMIDFDLNSGAGDDAELVSVCLQPGFYMLRVYGENATQGPYILLIGCEICNCDPPCTLECPPNALLENEHCPSFFDSTNGGCDTRIPRFLPLRCGDIYCGTGYSDMNYTDSDWYHFIVDQPQQVRLCVASEFDGYLTIFTRGPGLDDLCHPRDVVDCRFIVGCQGTQCLSVCLPKGEYNISFAATGLTPVNCLDYILSASCSPCEPVVCEAPDSLVIHYPDSNGTGNIYEDVVLYWPPVPGADEYRIYRTSNNNSTNIVTPANYIASTTDTFFVHDNILFVGGDEIFIYQVVAYCRFNHPPCIDLPAAATKPEIP